MVLREVGEDRGRPVDRVGAVQGERVAGDLHDDRVVAGGEHVGEGALQVDGLWRRAGHGVLLAADDRGHGAEQPGAPTTRLEQRAHEEGRRRLAVGPRDPDRRQPRCRVAGQGGGGGCHRGAHVVDEDLWDRGAQRPLHDERHRAARDRVVGVVVAVAREARHTEEQRPRRHEAVVVGERRDLDRGRVGADDLCQPHAPQPIAAGCACTAGRRRRSCRRPARRPRRRRSRPGARRPSRRSAAWGAARARSP